MTQDKKPIDWDVFRKALKYILVVVLFCYIALFTYHFLTTNSIGMEQYYGNDITAIYAGFSDRIYLTDGDGNAYMVGGYRALDYDSLADYKYEASEQRRNESLQMPAPVLFYEDGIRQIFPEANLLITASGTLYRIDEWNALEKICDNARFACTKRTEEETWNYYVVDEDNALWVINGEKKERLRQGVQSVDTHGERLFLLLTDGRLLEWNPKDGAEQLLLEGVASFALEDPDYYDDAVTKEIPTLLALTKTGDLMIRGILSSAKTDKVEFPEWSLLSEKVTCFDGQRYGVLYATESDGCFYEGFLDTKEMEMKYYSERLWEGSAKAVQLTWSMSIYIQDAEGTFYIWGAHHASPFISDNADTRRPFEDPPVIVKPGEGRIS